MSVATFFEGIEHSAVVWIEKELAKFTKDEPKIAGIADTLLSYAGPVLNIVLTDFVPGGAAIDAVVAPVINEAQKDLATFSSIVTDFGPTPTALTFLTSIKTNLSGLLTDTHVTDPKSVAAVQKVVTEIEAVEKIFSQLLPASTAAAPVAAAA